jgi:hypothetical protein
MYPFWTAPSQRFSNATPLLSTPCFAQPPFLRTNGTPTSVAWFDGDHRTACSTTDLRDACPASGLRIVLIKHLAITGRPLSSVPEYYLVAEQERCSEYIGKVVIPGKGATGLRLLGRCSHGPLRQCKNVCAWWMARPSTPSQCCQVMDRYGSWVWCCSQT